jgi:alanine dehydrogenase
VSRILVVRNDEIEEHVSPADCIPLVEGALQSMSEGKAELPQKYHDIGDWAMWFFMGGNVFPQQATAIKTGFAAPGALTCQVIYYDHETCEPKGLFEGLKVTNLRTGAAAAIGAKHMARSDSKVAAFIGAGQVCWHALGALVSVFDLEKVLVYDLSPEAAEDYVQRAQAKYGLTVEAVSAEQAVRGADVVISATPSREAIVQADWVQPGTHFSAMGSDGAGKQELASGVHQRARIVCDRTSQCLKWGDINVSITAGLVSESDIVGEIGDVVAGRIQGRTSPEEVTLFDGTGMGIQDAVVAKVIYDIAEREGLGTAVEL